MSGALESRGQSEGSVIFVTPSGHLKEGYKPQAASSKLAG
jgi:hypothetical protein